MFDSLQSLIGRLRSETVNSDEAIQCLDHDAALIRVNAVEAVARLASRNEALLPRLAMAIRDPRNKVRLLGTIRVSHVAFACLARIGTDQAIRTAVDILREWPQADRADLMWYLGSERLSLGSSDAVPE